MSHHNDFTDAEYRGCKVAINAFLILLLVGGILVIVFVASRVAATDDPLCLYFDALATQPGVEVAKWIGYPQGWRDMPTEWDYETFTNLVGESGILTPTKGKERWLWGFRTLAEDNGNHDFCSNVLIVSEDP